MLTRVHAALHPENVARPPPLRRQSARAATRAGPAEPGASEATGRSGRQCAEVKVQGVLAKLDAMSAPAVLELRVNMHNMEKQVAQKIQRASSANKSELRTAAAVYSGAEDPDKLSSSQGGSNEGQTAQGRTATRAAGLRHPDTLYTKDAVSDALPRLAKWRIQPLGSMDPIIYPEKATAERRSANRGCSAVSMDLGADSAVTLVKSPASREPRPSIEGNYMVRTTTDQSVELPGSAQKLVRQRSIIVGERAPAPLQEERSRGGERRRTSMVSQMPSRTEFKDSGLSVQSDEAAPYEDPMVEQKWIAAFRRLRIGSDIHRDKLEHAMELAGFGPRPRSDWTEQILRDMTRYSTLNLKEFIVFLRRFRAREVRSLEDAFAKIDHTGAGMIGGEEFGELLEGCGIVPVDQVVRELLIEVGQKNVRGHSLDECKRAFAILRERHGLSRKDVEKCRRTFAKFDCNGGGALDTKELTRILSWLGYASTREEAELLFADVGVGLGGTMNDAELLIVMRKLRDRDVRHLQDVLGDAQRRKNGLINRADLQNALVALGYFSSCEAIRDAVEDIHAHSPKKASSGQRRRLSSAQEFPDGFATSEAGCEFSLSDLVAFLELYRARDGLSREEIAEIEAAFHRYDRDREGAINALEVGKVLRWLGFRSSWELQQELAMEVDVHQSGRLDLGDLQKLIRMYRERDIHTMKQAFKEYDTTGLGVLSSADVSAALRSLGFVLPAEDLEGLGDAGEASSSSSDEEAVDESAEEIWHNFSGGHSGNNMVSFVRRALEQRRKERAAFQKNAGYGPVAVEAMRGHFRVFDADASGAISNQELRTLLEVRFPELSTSAKLRPYLVKLLGEVEADSNGDLDFPDFLRFMRQVHDLQERDKVRKEQHAVREARFSQEEVEGFRELFLGAATPSADEAPAELSFADLARMLGRVCPMGDRNRAHLSIVFESIVGNKSGGADFPEFLRLMRRLLDEKFANLEEYTRGAAGTTDAAEAVEAPEVASAQHVAGRRAHAPHLSQLVTA